jgi:hypothetical protein
LLGGDAKPPSVFRHNEQLANIGPKISNSVGRRPDSTRKSLACRPTAISPISSMNSVPPSATSTKPGLACTAPVKAPFSWPNSSLSSRLSCNAARGRLPLARPTQRPDGATQIAKAH